MSTLSDFMLPDLLEDEIVEFVASRRFMDKDTGAPLLWRLKSITSAEDEALKKSCTKKVPVSGKRGQFTKDLDLNMYLGKLAAACTVHPNLSDGALQDFYKTMGADALLKVMLRPGEYADYLLKIQEINGFATGFEDMVQEAKNS